MFVWPIKSGSAYFVVVKKRPIRLVSHTSLSLALQWWSGISEFAVNFLFLNHISYTRQFVLKDDHRHFCQLRYLIDSVILRSPDACFKNCFGNYFLHILYARSTLLFKTPQELCNSRLLKSFACCRKGELDLSMTWFLDLIIFDKTFWTHFLKKGWKK